MSRGFSLYLDALRFFAAIIVFASHLGYTRFTDGKMRWIRDLNLGSDAVILFFVLSGFVIAWTTFENRRSASEFARARAARLYSVVIPALVFTILIDQIGSQLFPARYSGWWYHAALPAEQILRGVTFSTQITGENFRIGTNGPFWSVAYEAWYYLAFGLAVYLRGARRWLVLGLVAFIAGPRILLLAPCWVMGLALYRVTNLQARPSVSRQTVFAFMVGPWVIYALCLSLGTPDQLKPVSQALLPGLELAFSDEYIWNTLIGGLFAVHFLGVFWWMGEADWIGMKLEKAIRWCAGATFSIYLFHYPIMTFLYAMPVYEPGNWLHAGMLSVVTLAACFALAEVSERKLSAWKLFFAPRRRAHTPS